MATLTNGGTTTKKTMKLQTRLPITEDDDKVLGRTTSLRREKAAALDQVHTLKLKTHNSAWTPMVHKPSNEQVGASVDIVCNGGRDSSVVRAPDS